MNVCVGLSGYSCAWASVLLTWAGGDWCHSHYAEDVWPQGKAQQRSSSCLPMTPCQDSGFLLLSLHGLFHLSWLASSFWVFSSTKWGESTVSGSRLSVSRVPGHQGFAVSGGCKLLGRRLSGGWMGAGVGIWDSLLSYYVWKLINWAAGRCQRCREGCSVVSLHLIWPSCGHGLALHNLSGIWVSRVKPLSPCLQ